MLAHLPLPYWPARWRTQSDAQRWHRPHPSDKRCCNGRPFALAGVVASSTAAAEYFARSGNIGGKQATTVRPVAVVIPESNRPGKLKAVLSRHVKDADEVDLGSKHVAMFWSRAGNRAAPLLTSWWCAVALSLLVLLPPACGVVDLTLYGGAFDSSSTIAYAEVSCVRLLYIEYLHVGLATHTQGQTSRYGYGQTPFLQNDF